MWVPCKLFIKTFLVICGSESSKFKAYTGFRICYLLNIGEAFVLEAL